MAVTSDPFDAVLADISAGTRKSPFAKKGPSAAKPAAPPKALVTKFVAMLSPLDDAKRAQTVAAFNAAVDQLSNEPGDENDAENADVPTAEQ